MLYCASRFINKFSSFYVNSKPPDFSEGFEFIEREEMVSRVLPHYRNRSALIFCATVIERNL